MGAQSAVSYPPSPPRPESLHALAQDWMERLDLSFDRWFGARHNPWRHLGALGFLFFWLIAATGIYLYIGFDTSVAGAYASVEQMSRPWSLSGLMRSLHRYASDAFMLVVLLHLVRELLLGRYYGFRWFTWITGVPLLWLTLFAGLVGFWLVWDDLGQFSAVASAEWLDGLGLFSEPFARNFTAAAGVEDRFFSLLVFLHIGLPLLLLLGMWVHIQRLSRPDALPAATLTWGTLAMLLALSLLRPVTSGAPAAAAHVPTDLAFDWFYLAPNAALYSLSAVQLWLVAGAVTLLLLVCPLLPHPSRAPVAEVDAANCNGCGRCFADCPYAAVVMQPRTDGRSGGQIAVVDAELCAACGICAGACPSSTPFRSAAELVSGIDMPQLPVGQLRSRLKAQLTRLKGDQKIVVFGCEHGADVRPLQSSETAVMSLICAGQLPPAFVEFALRHGADGVLIAACPEGGCAFRLGERWTQERLLGVREPHLRRTVAPSEWCLTNAGTRELDQVRRALAAFRARLRTHGVGRTDVSEAADA